MKQSIYTCDFCQKPIKDAREVFHGYGESYIWLFDYHKDFHLHIDGCVGAWSQAKREGKRAAHEVYKSYQKDYNEKS